jgi:Flp pilus assembly protein CpaB
VPLAAARSLCAQRRETSARAAGAWIDPSLQAQLLTAPTAQTISIANFDRAVTTSAAVAAADLRLGERLSVAQLVAVLSKRPSIIEDRLRAGGEG